MAQPIQIKKFRYLALAAALAVFGVIVMGGIVRVTGSGGACPDWPTCFGQWIPPLGVNASIDYLHRLTTFLASALILASTVWAFLHFRGEPWIARLLYLASGLLAVQIALGAVVASLGAAGRRPWVSSFHLGLSLFIQAAVLTAAVVAFRQAHSMEAGQPPKAALPGALSYRSPFARLSLATLGMAFLLLVSGAAVAAMGARTACASWPLCGGSLVPQDPAGWINAVHRLIVFFTGGLLVMLFIQAWRTQRTQTVILVSSTAALVLFVSQALMGARLVQGFPIYLLALHEATAVAVWGILTIQVAAVGLARRAAGEEREEAALIAGRKGLARDLLMLTKPVVVLLLLVTTFAGMVIGARSWPSVQLAFWTLLGGFLAAGGSGAINQYIDRCDDVKMQRTQKRPIPSGRLTPGEGLAFGVGIALASFYIMVAFVNFLAALLTLAGIVYYVLLYSILLKKMTVQNIVIGGGAGAIPPLVGWAAATGQLNIPSLFLFAVIFMWTPPHFWALSIVRRKDYARAGVPMLPVIRGEKEARWQIFLYTVELVGLTLLLPVAGLGGSIYLVGAAVLGALLLHTAWLVWRRGGNKVAWRMYRLSSMYLAFLFFVLMIDRLL
jgi:protoheme IX farnesyltransferase